MGKSVPVQKTIVREPFIRLVRHVARVLYDDYTTRSDNQQKSAKTDNRGIAVVVLDALTRRQWVREDDLAQDLKLPAKQLRKVLKHFQEQKLIMLEERKETAKHAKMYSRAYDKAKLRIHTYCCLDYSQIYDIVSFKLNWFKRKLKDELEDKNKIQEYSCPKCQRKYTALDAPTLLSMVDFLFHCENCGELLLESDKVTSGEVVSGDDNAKRRREKLKDLLETVEVRLKPLMEQMNRMKDLTPPEVESLSAWEARAAMAARQNGDFDANDPLRSQGGYGSTPMPFLGETKVEVELGEGKEDVKSEGGDSSRKVLPPWMIKQGMKLTDEQRGDTRQAEAKVDGGDEKKSAMGNGDDANKDLEACFREEYLKQYYAALLQKQQELAEMQNQQESAGHVQLATTSSDRQVGMKSKREEDDKEEDVDWEEEASVAANGNYIDLDREEDEDEVEWEEG